MQGVVGKNIVVTGGASGIGKATAKKFLTENANVIIIDKNKEACENLSVDLENLTAAYNADISNFDQVKSVFTQIDGIFNSIDILINNAGISIRHESFLDIKPEQWNNVISTNLTGTFYVAQQAAKRMMKQNAGVIINTASINGIVGFPHYADYNASKAGIIALSKSMALELAPHVRVLSICPGAVLTPMQEAEYTPAMLDAVNQKIPLKRHASSEEIANLFVFLSSDAAAFITGQEYIIDGGELAGGLASR